MNQSQINFVEDDEISTNQIMQSRLNLPFVDEIAAESKLM